MRFEDGFCSLFEIWVSFGMPFDDDSETEESKQLAFMMFFEDVRVFLRKNGMRIPDMEGSIYNYGISERAEICLIDKYNIPLPPAFHRIVCKETESPMLTKDENKILAEIMQDCPNVFYKPRKKILLEREFMTHE